MSAVMILGAGNVGTGFAMALERAGVPLVGIWNRGAARRERAASLLGCPTLATVESSHIKQADIILVCTHDNALGAMGQMLRGTGALLPTTVVAHTSGAVSAQALGALPPAQTGGIHPMLPCISPAQTALGLLGGHFSVEIAGQGNERATAVLQNLVQVLQGTAHLLPSTGKAAYHAACVMASNLVVALLHAAINEAHAAGLADAKGAMAALATHAAQEVMQRGAHEALTGPIKRGDWPTVESHLQALTEHQELYLALSNVAAKLAQKGD